MMLEFVLLNVQLGAIANTEMMSAVFLIWGFKQPEGSLHFSNKKLAISLH